VENEKIVADAGVADITARPNIETMAASNTRGAGRFDTYRHPPRPAGIRNLPPCPFGDHILSWGRLPPRPSRTLYQLDDSDGIEGRLIRGEYAMFIAQNGRVHRCVELGRRTRWCVLGASQRSIPSSNPSSPERTGGGVTSIRLSSDERYDEAVRNVLQDTRQILAGFEPPGRRRENHLLWAAPGTGKTYFVQQMAVSLPCGIRYHELNLARCMEVEFRSGSRSLSYRAPSQVVGDGSQSDVLPVPGRPGGRAGRWRGGRTRSRQPRPQKSPRPRARG
jgi:hypothetical protein